MSWALLLGLGMLSVRCMSFHYAHVMNAMEAWHSWVMPESFKALHEQQSFLKQQMLLQGFSYWIRQPGRDKKPAVSQERPETPNRSQGNTPSVSPFDSPSVSARNSADDEVDYNRLMR